MDPTRKEEPHGTDLSINATADPPTEMPSSLLPESEHVKHEGLEELRKALLEQLPPTDPSQVVPFGHLLDRTVKIRYEALRHLVQNR
jgi:hypothetical protein